MFIGKHYHKLESKGRVSLPKTFREQTKEWIVTRGLDGCLFLFKTQDFEKQLATVANSTFTKKAHRDLTRLMTNEAAKVNIDKNGRVHLPEYLIAFARLNKEVVIVGSFSRIEIWDMDAYHTYMDKTEKESEEIAESIE